MANEKFSVATGSLKNEGDRLTLLLHKEMQLLLSQVLLKNVLLLVLMGTNGCMQWPCINAQHTRTHKELQIFLKMLEFRRIFF